MKSSESKGDHECRTVLSEHALKSLSPFAYLRQRHLLAMVLLTLLCSAGVLGQTLEDCRSDLHRVEGVRPITRKITLSIKDDRFANKNMIGLSALESGLKDSLAVLNPRMGSALVDSSVVRPIELRLKIGYLGFYKTESGNWCGKCIADVEMHDPNRLSKIQTKTVSVDTPFRSGWFRLFGNSPKPEWQEEILRLALRRVMDEVRPFLSNANDAYREVTAFGSGRAASSVSATARDIAIQDALRRGCYLAWGTKIESEITMIDFGDVEERTKASTSGLILDYKVLPEYTRETAEGFICVVVKAVIASPFVAGMSKED